MTLFDNSKKNSEKEQSSFAKKLAEASAREAAQKEKLDAVRAENARRNAIMREERDARAKELKKQREEKQTAKAANDPAAHGYTLEREAIGTEEEVFPGGYAAGIGEFSHWDYYWQSPDGRRVSKAQALDEIARGADVVLAEIEAKKQTQRTARREKVARRRSVNTEVALFNPAHIDVNIADGLGLRVSVVRTSSNLIHKAVKYYLLHDGELLMHDNGNSGIDVKLKHISEYSSITIYPQMLAKLPDNIESDFRIGVKPSDQIKAFVAAEKDRLINWTFKTLSEGRYLENEDRAGLSLMIDEGKLKRPFKSGLMSAYETPLHEILSAYEKYLDNLAEVV